jgi:hypothetical protein
MGNVERQLSLLAAVSCGSIIPVRRLLWAHDTHYIELRQHGIVTASWKLLAATHLQRVMRRDLVNDSCAVRILGR